MRASKTSVKSGPTNGWARTCRIWHHAANSIVPGEADRTGNSRWLPEGVCRPMHNGVGAPERPSRLAVYPGVFDPPTLAHLEIIETALGLFDRLCVIVAVN